MLSGPLAIGARLAAALENFNVRYLVAGSRASSVYGISRATQDVDLVAELKHPVAAAKSLGTTFMSTST